jgi:hypothetical protein
MAILEWGLTSPEASKIDRLRTRNRIVKCWRGKSKWGFRVKESAA